MISSDKTAGSVPNFAAKRLYRTGQTFRPGSDKTLNRPESIPNPAVAGCNSDRAFKDCLTSGDRDLRSGVETSVRHTRRPNIGCHFSSFVPHFRTSADRQGTFACQINPGLKHLGCSVRPAAAGRKTLIKNETTPLCRALLSAIPT